MINYFVIINMVLRYQAFSYDVHWTLSRRTQKINSWTNQKGYDNSKTTNRKLLARKIQIFWVHFCVIHFLVFFKIPFKITSEEKRTRKNWILFVESSSTKVSGSSLRNSNGCACARELSACTYIHVIASTKHQSLENIKKI